MSDQPTKPESKDTNQHQHPTTSSLDNCPICQDELKDPESIRILPCAHKFHNDCIQKWIEMRNLCPLCKQVADTAQPVRELSNDNRDLTQQMIQSLLQNSINPTGVDFWMHFLEGFGLRNRPHQPFAYSNTGNITIESYAFDIEDRNGSVRMNMSMNPEVFSLFSHPMQIDDYGSDDYGPDDDDDDDEIVFSSTMSLLEEMDGEEVSARHHPERTWNRDPRLPLPASGVAIPNLIHSERPHHRLWSEVIAERTSQDSKDSNGTNPITTTATGNTITNTTTATGNAANIAGNNTQHLLIETAQSDACEQAQCANCYKLDCVHAIKRCSGCHQIRYCSKECQDENWTQHKDWCFAHRHS